MLGDSALLVDPTDTAALADGMEQLLHDDTLRATLVERGDRQWRKFNWESTACELVALYRKLART